LAGRNVLLVQAGIGRDCARDAVLAASREFDVQAVWSLGFAGGLCERLRAGDLVCPGVVLNGADPTAPPHLAHASHEGVCAALRGANLGVEPGPLITVTTALHTPDAKRALGARSKAAAVEMEAAGVARAAHDLCIPWLALKVIVDGVDDPLPAWLSACTTAQGNLRWRGLWSGMREGRDFWRTMRRLAGASREAGQNLRRGLDAAFRAWVALTAT
jgi:nucleoside phosphorylase